MKVHSMTEKVLLIVDDSEFDRKILGDALANRREFKTIAVKNGDECLGIIANQKIDLVLMDIMMPGVSGAEVLVKIREKFNPIDLPVIMVTSKMDASDVVESLQNGANDYIKKPINFEIVVTRILTHLKLTEISHEMVRLKELAALNAMIVTYNHEINNPLSIALSYLSKPEWNSEESRKKLEDVLWRVVDIVKKITAVSSQKEIEYQKYANLNKMIKIK